jgi:hypothetical protein
MNREAAKNAKKAARFSLDVFRVLCGQFHLRQISPIDSAKEGQ